MQSRGGGAGLQRRSGAVSILPESPRRVGDGIAEDSIPRSTQLLVPRPTPVFLIPFVLEDTAGVYTHAQWQRRPGMRSAHLTNTRCRFASQMRSTASIKLLTVGADESTSNGKCVTLTGFGSSSGFSSRG